MYKSTKNYGNDRGFSCCFRQPNASHSHCSLLHGYSLGFKFTFAADTLDDKNWVWDFGDTKWLKAYLEDTFDHTLAVDRKDPKLNELLKLSDSGLANIVQMDGVGCEKFAENVFRFAAPIVDTRSEGRVKLIEVECYEHGANSAIFTGEI